MGATIVVMVLMKKTVQVMNQLLMRQLRHLHPWLPLCRPMKIRLKLQRLAMTFY